MRSRRAMTVFPEAAQKNHRAARPRCFQGLAKGFSGQFEGRCRRGARGLARERRVRGASHEFLGELAKEPARKTRNRTRRAKVRRRIVAVGAPAKKGRTAAACAGRVSGYSLAIGRRRGRGRRHDRHARARQRLGDGGDAPEGAHGHIRRGTSRTSRLNRASGARPAQGDRAAHRRGGFRFARCGQGQGPGEAPPDAGSRSETHFRSPRLARRDEDSEQHRTLRGEAARDARDARNPATALIPCRTDVYFSIPLPVISLRPVLIRPLQPDPTRNKRRRTRPRTRRRGRRCPRGGGSTRITSGSCA